jgi:hypothetical protein
MKRMQTIQIILIFIFSIMLFMAIYKMQSEIEKLKADNIILHKKIVIMIDTLNFDTPFPK